MRASDEGRDEPPTLDERVQVQREQIFKAMSIVECCKLSTASLYAQESQESMVPALEAAYDLLNAVGAMLEAIASDFKKLCATGPRSRKGLTLIPADE